MPPADVLIGAGGSGYISSQILTKLRNENSQTGKHVLVEQQAGVDGGDALMAKANNPATNKLAGLFDQVYHNADYSGYNADNPTLSESTRAAIKVLSRNPNGFVLMIEGGAVDWASHANNMNQMIGEQKDYDNAVQTVIDWVNDPANDSNWNNTLVIATGDHECGYLTKASGVFPNQSLGNVNNTTLAKEKIVSGTGGRRASWEDTDSDNIIDTGETVYWQWNSGGHSNTLIPLYARGAGSELLAGYASRGPDTERGYYLDNTDVFLVMDSALSGETCVETGSVTITPGQILSGNPVNLTSLVTENNATNARYTVSWGIECPSQTNASVISRQSTWKYDIENTGNVWMNTGYNDSGWSAGSGIFGTEEHLAITTPVSNQNRSMFFRKTFTVCNPSEVTALTLNSLFDDGMVVYINGTQVYSQGVTGNPPPYNGGVSSQHEAENYEAKDLTSVIGLAALRDLLIAGSGNVIAVGIYNKLPLSSDIVWDSELLIDQNANGFTLFSGNSTQARSVDTTGWTAGEKDLKVTADDAVCLTPLPSANGAFNYQIHTTTAGITVNPTSGLTTTEARGTAVFSVVLNTRPAARVMIDLFCSDTTEGRVSPGTLTFYPENWSTARSVTITGVNDYVADGNQTYKIITQAAVSSDSKYNGIDPDNVSVTNMDNDMTGIIIEPSSGLSTNESGSAAGFTIKLNSQPLGDVIIGLSSSDMTEGTVSPSGLTFTSVNWNIAQSVTVMGINDFEADGNQTYFIVTHPAVSSDPGYAGLDPVDLTVVNNDNEQPGITVNPISGLKTTESGGKAVFIIVLNKAPASMVTIDLSSSNTREGRVSPASLTFTTENWNKARKITVTGVDDFFNDGDQSYKIITHAAVSTDSAYNGLNAEDVLVINSDNERP
jgi:hypothetical protein